MCFGKKDEWATPILDPLFQIMKAADVYVDTNKKKHGQWKHSGMVKYNGTWIFYVLCKTESGASARLGAVRGASDNISYYAMHKGMLLYTTGIDTRHKRTRTTSTTCTHWCKCICTNNFRTISSEHATQPKKAGRNRWFFLLFSVVLRLFADRKRLHASRALPCVCRCSRWPRIIVLIGRTHSVEMCYVYTNHRAHAKISPTTAKNEKVSHER